MNKLPFFNYLIQNQTDDRLDVYIDGTIVDAETQEIYREWFNDQSSVSFKSFRNTVVSSGVKNIRITINSFGGQIGDAMAMHDFIQQLENEGYKIETIGIGMVCSAATYILSASKNSKISKNAYYMIHNVSGGVWGDVNEIEKYAQNLRKFNNNIRDFYSNLTGKTNDEVEKWMNAETWFYGKEVQDNGFVKETVGENSVSNAINQKDWSFKNVSVLNAYNALVKSPENNQNLDLLNMKNLASIVGAAVTNALVNSKLFSKNEEGEETPVTNELITNAIEKAFEGVDFETVINSAVEDQFKDGLPEKILEQITNAVKENVTPENFKESEDWKGLEKRLGDIENKAAKNIGQAKPKNSGEGTDKYADREDIGFSE